MRTWEVPVGWPGWSRGRQFTRSSDMVNLASNISTYIYLTVPSSKDRYGISNRPLL